MFVMFCFGLEQNERTIKEVPGTFKSIGTGQARQVFILPSNKDSKIPLRNKHPSQFLWVGTSRLGWNMYGTLIIKLIVGLKD